MKLRGLIWAVALSLPMWYGAGQALANHKQDCVETETVIEVPGAWWNFSPNKQNRPFQGPPAFPHDDRGTWQGPHVNGGPSQDKTGTFQQGQGNGSWFHREQPSQRTVVEVECSPIKHDNEPEEPGNHAPGTNPGNPGAGPLPVTGPAQDAILFGAIALVLAAMGTWAIWWTRKERGHSS